MLFMVITICKPYNICFFNLICYFLFLINLIDQKGARKVVRLGDRFVDWNPQFRLFMFSAIGVPITSPQASALVNTVNFNTTEASLTEQVS